MNVEGRTASSRYRHASAFTLVELLVVVAVIASLMAILLPSLRMAREQSARVKCMSNLRVLSQGWAYYLEDHSGRFPGRHARDDINYGGRQGAAEDHGENGDEPVAKYLNPYLNIPLVTTDPLEMYQCPRDRGTDTIQPSYYVSRGTSYRANHFLLGRRINCRIFDDDGAGCKDRCQELNGRIGDLREDAIRTPAKVLLFGDYPWRLAWEWMENRAPVDSWHARDGFYNLTYLDTHAELVRIKPHVWTTHAYTVVPVRKLEGLLIAACQGEEL